jgi:hypothetical protein
MAGPDTKDLFAAAHALILLAEKRKLDATTEGYTIIQTLKDEMAIYEISQKAPAPETELALC